MLDVLFGLIFVVCCVGLAFLVFLGSSKINKRLPVNVIIPIRAFAQYGSYILVFVLMVLALFIGVAILSCLGQWIRSAF